MPDTERCKGAKEISLKLAGMECQGIVDVEGGYYPGESAPISGCRFCNVEARAHAEASVVRERLR